MYCNYNVITITNVTFLLTRTVHTHTYYIYTYVYTIKHGTVLNGRDYHENCGFQIFRTFTKYLTIGFS